ncbi:MULTISPECIES: H-type small acid-soluble spore protein [Gracilibacillus]|uniref:Small, acid-soluble spore protein H n=1 Tax=Gracilibacillus dipsosauri TaxID=178340 RepID=A0A317L0T5_9BACI|nr:H-type small acid-soluble spore protein [Gracilibacillus dipsosauri]PWU68458.1 H-type small acid-soluble spore protein [Gracilibacillus dipsosauri]
MDAKRAQEIANASEMCQVTYNGTNVYIEHVDQNSGKATVHPLNNKTSKWSVTVDELLEQ